MRRTLGAVVVVTITVALAAWWATRPGEKRTTDPDSPGPNAVEGREARLREEVPAIAFAAMDALIAAKVREQTSGTLSAARQWANRELDALMWERTASDLGLGKDELEKCWKERRVAQSRVATYAKGSFIVVKKQTGPGAAQPPAEEDWWTSADVTERSGFLTAYFVETSGRFAILRADETDCAACGGRRDVTRAVCAQCNGCGVVRSVTYR